jgi:hypothetical protein
MCAPVSGKAVLLWLKVAVVQDEVLWHVAQGVGKPAVT